MQTPPITELATSETAASPVSDCSTSILNGREARNLAEKQRRDKLNASISELAKMVPHVADSPRRLDKTAVLRFATHGLRLQYVFGNSGSKREKSTNLDDHQLTNTLLQLIDSFFITLTCHGQIILISTSVESLLGHCQSDLYGQNILQITHPEDQDMLRQQLIPKDIESLFADFHNVTRTQPPAHNSEAATMFYAANQQYSYGQQATRPLLQQNGQTTDEKFLDRLDAKLRSDKRSFTVRLARASTRSESKKVYELVKIDGCFRRSDHSAVSTGNHSFPIVSQLIRRSRNNNLTTSAMAGGDANACSGNISNGVYIPHLLQHDTIAQAALHGVSGNDIVLVAMARIIRPPKIINWPLEANRLEYKTRHLIDGRIIDCDHRIGLVAGYLQEEVRNLSPFSFMHQDDVRWVIVALRQMYDCNSDYGESCYRLLSRNGNFIYLQSKGYLDIDKGTNKVHSFICINTLLDEEEGKRKVQEMKNKFSIIINAKVPTSTKQDVVASQNPQQLEKIVLYLIENLQKRQTNNCIVDEIHSEEDVKRHTSTPPLALVPPEPSSVKNSISKSVSVVTATAARSFVIKNKLKTEKINKEEKQNSDTMENRDNIPNDNTTTTAAAAASVSAVIVPQQRPSVLQMTNKTGQIDKTSHKTSASQALPKQHISVLKRLRTEPIESDIKSVLPTKLIAIDVGNIEQQNKRTNSNSSNTSMVICSNNSSTSPSSSSSSTSPLCGDEIHLFIDKSLKNVGESLSQIDAQTITLRQQCSSAASIPPTLDNQFDAIIMEQQIQNEFLVNIKNEYKVYKERQQQQQQEQQNEQCQLSAPTAIPPPALPSASGSSILSIHRSHIRRPPEQTHPQLPPSSPESSL